MDYNPDNYTISELLIILNLDDPDSSQVIDTTNEYITRFTQENQPNMVNFFQDVQTKILTYMKQLENDNSDAEYTPDAKQTDEWYKYESLPQKDAIQRDKNTDRIQKIDVYDNHHVPMNRKQLGVTNAKAVPVAQDTLNPTLKNTIKRFINLDSQFRQPAGVAEAMSTNYTLDLSDPLTNVLNLRLYSIQIPYAWYVIDYVYGNTCLWVTNQGDTFKISLEPGNYQPEAFCSAIQEAFTDPTDPSSGIFTYPVAVPTDPNPMIAIYNINNGKITLNLDGWIDPAGNTITGIDPTTPFNSANNAYYTFFDMTGGKTCYESGTYPCGSTTQGQTFSGTLGWLMGFRLPVQSIHVSQITFTAGVYKYKGGNKAQSLINLTGSKYFIVVLDDYNQNHINNGLVTITELSKTLAIPTYYNSSQPYICTPVTSNPNMALTDIVNNLNNIDPDAAVALGMNPANITDELLNTTANSGASVPLLLPSAPRTLTNAQIYTANQIIKNRSKTTSFRAKAPTNSDTFAIIPIKGSIKTGETYVELSGSLQDNSRIYFGPVNIDRLHIKLIDDRGNIVDLHGSDWSITLISESLYQY